MVSKEESKDEPWPTSIFEHIQSDQTLDFDWYLDITDLLVDKAITPSLLSWTQEYNMSAYKVLHGRYNRQPRGESRLVMEHLKRDAIDTRDIVRRVTKMENINDRVQVVVPKEKKKKRSAARGFTKLSYDTRMYQAITEDNMKKVLNYFPYQTITLTGTQVAQHLFTLSTPSKPSIKINIDFSRWCLHMSSELVDPCAKVVDQLFGLDKMFAFSHEFSELFLPIQGYFLPSKATPHNRFTYSRTIMCIWSNDLGGGDEAEALDISDPMPYYPIS